MTKPGSGQNRLPGFTAVQDQAVFRGQGGCGPCRWKQEIAPVSAAAKITSKCHKPKIPSLGESLLFLSVGRHLQLAGRFTITVLAKGYQLFCTLFRLDDKTNEVSVYTARSRHFQLYFCKSAVHPYSFYIILKSIDIIQ